MVTPTALNGAGCAAAVPAISAEANNKAANIPVFMAASLLGWIASSWRCVDAISPYLNYHAPSVLKTGKMSLHGKTRSHSHCAMNTALRETGHSRHRQDGPILTPNK